MIYEVGTKSGVYCIENGSAARVYYVAAERTLIDAGTPGKCDRILSALAQIGVQPLHVKRIIITHHHWDHVGSLWELKKRTGAEVVAHMRDAEYITGKRHRRPPRGAVGRIAYALLSTFGTRNVQGVDVERRVNDGDSIGGFMVIHTPGHTPGHICLLRDGYLFSGDLLQPTAGEFCETPHIFTADVPTSRASIRRVAELDFQFVLAAHSPPHVFGSIEKMRAFVNHLGQIN